MPTGVLRAVHASGGRPVHDRHRPSAPSPDPCLVPSMTPSRLTAMMLVLVDRRVGQWPTTPMPATFSTADLAERLQRGREHRLDLSLLRDVGVERDECVAQLPGGLLLPAADVGAEHPAPSRTNTRADARHARAGTGDDGDSSFELSHARGSRELERSLQFRVGGGGRTKTRGWPIPDDPEPRPPRSARVSWTRRSRSCSATGMPR